MNILGKTTNQKSKQQLFETGTRVASAAFVVYEACKELDIDEFIKVFDPEKGLSDKKHNEFLNIVLAKVGELVDRKGSIYAVYARAFTEPYTALFKSSLEMSAVTFLSVQKMYLMEIIESKRNRNGNK